MSTAVMFSSRKWRRMAMALQPQQLSSSMVTPGANRGRAGHKQHLGGGRGLRARDPDGATVSPILSGTCSCSQPHALSESLPCKALQSVPQASPYSAS